MSLESVEVFALDDDASTRRFIELLLKNYGVTYKIFATAEEMAKELKAGIIPEVCLLDINLSQSNVGEGFSLIKAIRNKIPQKFALFAISRRNSSDDIALALDNGADEYIQKPLDPINLKILLSRYIASIEEEKLAKNTIAPPKSVCTLEEQLDLVEAGETYLIFETDFLIVKNTKLTLSGTTINEMTGFESLNVFVDSNSKLEESERFQIRIDLADHEQKVLMSLRKWISNQLP